MEMTLESDMETTVADRGIDAQMIDAGMMGVP